MAVSCLGGSATTKRQILDTPLIGHELQGPCASLHAALHCTARPTRVRDGIATVVRLWPCVAVSHGVVVASV